MHFNSLNQSQIYRSKYSSEENISWSYSGNFSDHVTELSDNNSRSADLIKHDPLYIGIPLTFLYSFILIAGISGNLITCVVILRNKYLHTTTNYYLFSLAISDLLLLTFGLPQEIYYIWSR